MRRQVRSTNPLRMTLLGAAAVAALLLALPGAGSYAAWNDSAPIGGTVTTGSLGIDQDAITGGTWTRSGTTFDPATDRLTAGDMLTYAVTDVPVTAVGDNLKATFSVSGAELPDSIKGHVEVAITSDPVPVQGAKSDDDGHQTVKLTLAVIADDTLPSGEQTIDLSKLTVTLTNGHGWSDTAILDAGTLTTGGSTAPGGKVDLSYNLEYDADKVVGFYLQDPLPGTKIKWNLWNGGTEVTTDAVDGLNSMDYSGSTQTPWIEIVGGFSGFGSPEQTVDLIGALTYVNGWNDDIGSTDGSYAFKDAIHLGGVSGLPSTLTDTSYAFQNAGSAAGADSNIQLPNWDSSNVTTMAHMFDGASNYRQYSPSWDTSNVTDMSYMFAGATSFNSPVGFTSTAAVTTMEGMFKNSGLESVNLNLDTSSVTNMSSMFEGASKYNGNPSTNGSIWDVSNVTTMAKMFDGAKIFNGDVTRWDTRSVTTMESMFKNASGFNGNIDAWDTANVARFSSMFNGATAFNGNIEGWNTSTATNMSQMFKGATSFNQDISGWDTQHVTTMQEMFRGASSFSQDLKGWDVAKVGNHTDFATGSGLSTEQLPRWNGTMAAPAPAAPAASAASAQADDATEADGQPAESTSDTMTPSPEATEPEATEPEATEPGATDTAGTTDEGKEDVAPEETPAPEEQVDPDQAVEALEDAWRNAQDADTDEARQALEDAAKVVDAVLGAGAADELLQQLEDDAATAPATAEPTGPAGA